jgi:hypothetical protein
MPVAHEIEMRNLLNEVVLVLVIEQNDLRTSSVNAKFEGAINLAQYQKAQIIACGRKPYVGAGNRITATKADRWLSL